jgi:RNA polymerase sigma factor (sigma-70 family)
MVCRRHCSSDRSRLTVPATAFVTPRTGVVRERDADYPTVQPPLQQSLRFRAVFEDSRLWDEAMARRIVAGDDSALAKVYDRYSPIVFGIARRLLGRDHADDVCQEVFLSLWQSCDRFDRERGSMASFLATIAHRRCIDELRKSGRRAANEERSVVLSTTLHPAQTDMVVATQLSAETVRSAVEALPDLQREAITLAYFRGLTFKQVAVATGVSEGTAKSRLRLAQQRLATMLSDLQMADSI